VDESATDGGFEWGYALPGAPTGTNDEYIGYIVRYPYEKIRTGTKANYGKARFPAAGQKGMVRH